MVRRPLILLFAFVASGLASPVLAEWRVSSGAYLSAGDYGRDEDTRMRVLLQGVQWRTRDYSIKLAVPWLHVDGPGDLIRSGERLAGESSSGPGDASLEGIRSLSVADDWWLDVRLKWKFPTADESEGLGSGEHDQQLGMDLAHLAGRWTWFGGLALQHRGKVPGEQFRDSAEGRLGVQTSVAPGWSVGILAECRDAARKNREPLREAAAFVTWRPDPRWRINLLGLKGYSSSGPDWLAGSQVAWSF